MRLFGMLGSDESKWPLLVNNLIEAYQRCLLEQRKLDARPGDKGKELIQADQSMGLAMESQFTLTEKSLSSSLEEAFEVMKLFTTSTATKTITAHQIFSCSKAALLIANLTCLLNQSSPCFWSAASSSLISIQEFTNYARHTTSDLFGDLDRVSAWSDFIGQAEQTIYTISNIRIGNFGKVFSVSDSLCGNPAPRRETGKEVAGTISSRTTGGGGLGTDFECSGGLQVWPAETASTLNASFGSKLGLENQHINSGAPLFVPSYGIPGNWIGRAPENGGNAVEPMIDVSPCQTTTDRHGVAYAFEPGSIARNAGPSNESELVSTLRANMGDNQPAVRQGMAVRRLTPTECERLQGFPEIKKTYRIAVINQRDKSACYLGQLSTDVHAEAHCHKLQNNASPAEEIGLPLYVNHADRVLSIPEADQETHALVHVQINLERSLVQIRSAGKLILSVSIAGTQSEFRLPIPAEDFVHLVALMTRTEEKITTSGKAEYQASEIGSLDHQSGSMHNALCGSEIKELVSDAEMFTKAVKGHLKSITSQAGQSSLASEQKRKTSLCFVAAAIYGFIPDQTRIASSFDLSVTVSHGYTLIPHRGKPSADGPRYKALGNSMAVPVMRWIGERIQAMENHNI
jgi:site-specific DNA-cytosine methylase